MGDYRNAYRNLQIQKSHQDSVYNETRSQQLAEAEKRFEADKKDQEIMLLRQEQMIKDLEIDQHRAERTALISAMILAAFILIYLYNRHKQRQKAEVNKQLLRQKELHLKAIVETQELERKRIAKDLHDGVGQTLSGVKLKMDSLINKADAIPEKEVVKLKDLVEHIDEACTEVRSISHQMMPKVLQEDGLIPAIGDMLEKAFRNTNIAFVYEHYGISSRLQENVEVGLYRICQELVNNIIKHSGANRVNVQLIKNTGMLVLLVEDNGRGMSNGNSKSKGIGLMNINSRVETINGEFNLEPSPISGTLATIRIPIKWQE
jgi:signal transduction histidine kinase